MPLKEQLFTKKHKKMEIIILGATGSIGKSTLDVIRAHPEQFHILGIAAHSNFKELKKIADEFNVPNIAIEDDNAYLKLRESYENDKSKHIYGGKNGILELASIKADLVVAAIAGINGLMPTVQALKSSKKIALANKEALICGGHLLKLIALEYDAEIIPIDSEHNSAYQLIHHENHASIKKLTLTASGGAFIDMAASDMVNITPEQAVKHPNWSMGAKVSVDSATLVNKGLELIEAYYLFNLKPNQLDAVIHRSSSVHSVVDFVDGTTLMNMYNPHMIVPISHALSLGERLELNHAHFDILRDSHKLEFEAVDYIRFPGFKAAVDVIKTENQSCMIAYNAANEFAVDAFLKGKAKFTDIPKIINEVLDGFNSAHINDFDDIIELDIKIKAKCKEIVTEGVI